MKQFPNLAEPDNDPRLWLEEIEDPRALAWVEAQNERTLRRFASGSFERDRDALAAIADRPDRIPFAARRSGLMYNFWTDADHPRGVWRRASQASYLADAPEWELLLDLDQLAREENEDWVWCGSTWLPAQRDRAMIALSRGGADAVTYREFDLPSRCFLPDGFTLPEAKQSLAWLDRDTLLVASALGPDRTTDSGYARSIRRWRRGEAFERAEVLFEVAKTHMSALLSINRTTQDLPLSFVDRVGFFDTVVHVGDSSGPKQRVDLPTDANWSRHGEFVAIYLRTEWSVGDQTYRPDSLLGARFADVLAGKPRLERLFEPEARQSLKHFFWSDGTLILSVLDNLRPGFLAFRPDQQGWHRTDIATPTDDGIVDLWPVDADSGEANGDLLMSVQTPLTPATLLFAEQGKAPRIIRQASEAFASDGLVISRHEAISSDGARIPYVQVGPAGTRGDAPVLMYGYGGFQLTQLPYYNGAVGKLWLERGGTYVLCHLRGGGEFGAGWHKAGMREGKALSHDDFAAVAADLVSRGVTRPERIAAEGGSNGGLLIANMLTRYPKRFGALFCTIPLIDMRRYTQLLAGASWVAEYGDPAKAKDWSFLQHISAYHHAEAGRPYPPILIATSRRDDRVHPGHARKMAAKLEELGHQVWFHEPADGGHGYGKSSFERAAFTALGYNFLRQSIGFEG